MIAMVAYDAFISYSHAEDRPVAAALQSIIQKLGKPWYRRRSLRVFRDDTSLSASPHLWESIEEALNGSRFLVLLASHRAAASPWVTKEVAWWLEHKGIETLLIGLTEGDLPWDPETGDFIWSEKTPLPAILKRRFTADPRWIDLRPYRGAVLARHRQFLDAGADFAATLHGRPKDDLLSQEVRQQRRALTLAWSAVASLLVLVCLAGWQWLEAVHARRLAEAQRDRAEKTLAAATRTANALVMDLALKFRDRSGVPIDMVRSILGRVQVLQEELVSSGEVASDLRQSRGVSLSESSATLLIQGDGRGALDAAKAAHQIFEALLAEQPADAVRRYNLSVAEERVGDALLAAERADAALDAYRRSLGLVETLSGADAGNMLWRHALSLGHLKVGDVLAARAARDAALDAFRKSLDAAEQLVAVDPGNAEWQRDLMHAHQRIGDMLSASGKREEASDNYGRALAVAKALAITDLGNSKWQRDVLIGHNKIGRVLLANGQPQLAVDAFRKGVAIAEKLVAGDVGNAEWQVDLAIGYTTLGDALLKTGQREQALDIHRKSLGILEKLLVTDPANRRWRRDLSVSYARVGDVLAALEQRDDALDVYRQAHLIVEKLAAEDPGNPQWEIDLCASLWRQAELGVEPERSVARVVEGLGRLDRAHLLTDFQRSFLAKASARLVELRTER